jgi:hypothetical protein
LIREGIPLTQEHLSILSIKNAETGRIVFVFQSTAQLFELTVELSSSIRRNHEYAGVAFSRTKSR